MANSFTDVVVGSGATVTAPNFDVKFSDKDNAQLGLILSDSRGRLNPASLKVAAMPRTPLRTSQGASGYDDMELPFVAEVQTTMIGGRGQETFSSDRTKFYDSYRLDTTKEYPVCAPAVIAQTGITPLTNVTLHSELNYINASTSPLLIEYDIVSTTISKITISVRTLGYIIISYTPHVGESQPTIDTLAEQSYFTTLMGNNDWQTVELPFTAVTTTANFWMTILCTRPVWTPGPGDIHFKTATTTDGNIYSKVDDAWALKTADAFLYSVIDTAPAEYNVKLFEYKRQLYAIDNNTNKAGAKLFMNGWRGVADANTGELSKLKDATQTGWADNAAEGCVVLITNGTGEAEDQPWRLITSSASGELTVSSPWKITHDTTTEYVILGSDVWTEITPDAGMLTKAVKDVAIVNDYVVFAFGTAQKMSFYNVDQSSNAFRDRWALESASYADFLCPIVHENGELRLWKADADASTVSCCRPPAFAETAMTCTFDVNYEKRVDAQIQRARMGADHKTEKDKPATEEDAGYLTSLARQITDLTSQITQGTTITISVAGDYSAYNGSYSVVHQFLPTSIVCGNTNSRITNLVPYGNPIQLYVMKEDSFGSVYNNVYAEIPLSELKAVRSEINGKTAMHYGVYLYFNLEGGRIERYYDQRIDDIGFNRDEGLPSIRQGEISKLLPYPGRFYASCNAGLYGQSSVLCHNGLGWHEIYRSGTIGQAISDLYIQAIPGNNYADRMWISEGSDLLALPISITPLQQYQYEYYGHGLSDSSLGYVETSWIDFELKDVNKYFHSINIFSDYTGEMTANDMYKILVYFKVDNDKDWTYVGRIRTSPSQELALVYPNTGYRKTYNVAGKKIKFKLAFAPLNSAYESPRLKAIVVNGVLRMPVKRSWDMTFLLEPKVDLQDRVLSDNDGAIYNRLFDWANSETHYTPLYMETNDAITDKKYVFIDPATIHTYQAVAAVNDSSGDKEYRHIGSMTIYEV